VGLDISREEFDDADHMAFATQLERNLRALAHTLGRPGFGTGPTSIGTELELNLVDASARPAPLNQEVLAEAADPRITHEINRFNLEINAPPVPLEGCPFSAMYAELQGALATTHRAARAHGARVVSIGILPTLVEPDLASGVLTDSARYRALSAGILRARGEPFRVHIIGDDELFVHAHDVTFEGANTSFQVHLRVLPERFADTYNAAQLATGLVLSVAGNSPFFFGKRLWHETRIALFRQAVDDRGDLADEDWRPSRVSFGHGWVRRGAAELFAEAVALHEPLLPVVSAENADAVCRHGGIPELAELRLHSGTVWRWNRAVYDPKGDGHLRIEFRTLPAGPSLRDMIANMAFLIGLTLGLAPDMARHTERITFGQARRNFYEGARLGLLAELLWPSARAPSPRCLTVAQAATELLPLARQGLVSEGHVAGAEADAWLDIIRERVERGQTGAVWQRAAWQRLAPGRSVQAACRALLERYIELSNDGRPVHQWPVP
jgi:hypothetical protein